MHEIYRGNFYTLKIPKIFLISTTAQAKKSCRCDGQKALNFVLDQIPVLRWLPKYNLKENLVGDIMSGFTISVLHLPQVKKNIKMNNKIKKLLKWITRSNDVQ